VGAEEAVWGGVEAWQIVVEEAAGAGVETFWRSGQVRKVEVGENHTDARFLPLLLLLLVVLAAASPSVPTRDMGEGEDTARPYGGCHRPVASPGAYS
jgi:hypothetical protein